MIEKAKVRNQKSVMLKIFVVIISAAVLVLLVISGCGDNVPSRVPPALDYEVMTPAINPENADAWRVLPTLEYELIVRCGVCRDALVDREIWAEAMAVDPHTGLRYEHICERPETDFTFSSGYISVPFVYDPQRDLFGHPGLDYGAGGGWTNEPLIGLHPFDVFKEKVENGDLTAIFCIPSRLVGFGWIESVDSSMKEKFTDHRNRSVYRLPRDAHTGKFALKYNMEFITAFMFDEARYLATELIAVRIGDYWGAIDKNGVLILPFEFDRFRRIDDFTAFARYNGKYGIIYLR